VAVIVGIIVIAVAYLPIGGSTTLQSTTTLQGDTISNLGSYPTSAETTNSTLGLELIASTNTSSIQRGQAIVVSVSIFNSLSRTNNVSGASDWSLGALANSSYYLSQGFICFRPANFVVFQGYYDSANVSSAKSPLQLRSAPVPISSCHKSNFSLYMFQPLSSTANVTLTNPPNYDYTINMQVSSLIQQYCTSSEGSEGICFTGFSPGTYTIAAGDEWGALVLLHFLVVPNPVNGTSSTTP